MINLNNGFSLEALTNASGVSVNYIWEWAFVFETNGSGARLFIGLKCVLSIWVFFYANEIEVLASFDELESALGEPLDSRYGCA